MTKSAASLIIIMVQVGGRAMGSGSSPPHQQAHAKETGMRIMIHKVVDGVVARTVVPGRRARLSPIHITGTDGDAVRAELATVIDEVTRKERGLDVPAPG